MWFFSGFEKDKWNEFIGNLEDYFRKTIEWMSILVIVTIMFIKFCQQLKKTVDRTGLEPVTSALSKQRSKPTELTIQEAKCIFFLNSIESNQPFLVRIVSKLAFFALLFIVDFLYPKSIIFISSFGISLFVKINIRKAMLMVTLLFNSTIIYA